MNNNFYIILSKNPNALPNQNAENQNAENQNAENQNAENQNAENQNDIRKPSKNYNRERRIGILPSQQIPC
jgi:hypothetical protein